MKLAILLALLCNSVASDINLDSYNLKWSDEFDGRALDQTKWSLEEGERRDAVNTLDVIKVENGCLTISPISRDGFHSTSMISTEKSFRSAYGYWEARVKLHTEPGAWSDFWLYCHSMVSKDDYSTSAELDIFEHRAMDDKGNILSNNLTHMIHWNGYINPQSNGFISDGIKCDEFNTVGLLWTKEWYIFYVNGKEVWKIKDGLIKRPLFAILSVEIQDGYWAGNVPKNGYTGAPMLTVDYVRYYQEKELK